MLGSFLTMHVLSPDQQARTGLGAPPSSGDDEKLLFYVNLKLRDLGCPTFPLRSEHDFASLMDGMLALSHEKDRLLSTYLCPVDQRIQNFLYDYLQDAVEVPRLPVQTFVLDRFGLARALSLPPDRDVHVTEILASYRVRQGVLHNPKSDRRTTQGIFHVTEGGLPVPDDKKVVPKAVFGRLLHHALRPPAELMRLPFTATQPSPAECFVSLLLRPVVCPAVEGVIAEKSMEVRFFAPGGLVANLDFVESVFGNGGDPRLPENDAALDPIHWTGHSGCIILAPHLTRLTKQELGLPRWEDATDRQRRDSMCWCDPAERYNDGVAFKVTARDASGVVVTILSDNYFGYCKKEVKSYISFSANLFGLCEEEHAGGALLFTRYDLDEDFAAARVITKYPRTLAEALTLLGGQAVPQPEGHAADRLYPDIIYVPEDAHFDLPGAAVRWTHDGREQRLKLRYRHSYVLPSGFKVHLDKPPRQRDVAPRRHPRRVHALPQAEHGLRRRQVRDLQKPDRCHHPGPGLRRRLPVRLRRRRRPAGPGLLRALPRPGPPRHRSAPDPQSASIPGLGHQALHAVRRRAPRRLQCLARNDSAAHQGAGAGREAVLPAGVGRPVAGAFQRRRDQRRPRQRTPAAQPAA